MRFIKGFLIWLLSAFLLLCLYSGTLPRDDAGKVMLTPIAAAALLVVPIALASFFVRTGKTKSHAKGYRNGRPRGTEPFNSSFASAGTYKIILERKRQIFGSAAKHSVFLDGIQVGEIHNGEVMAIGTVPGLHTLSVKGFLQRPDSIGFTISPGQIETYIFDKVNLATSSPELELTDTGSIHDDPPRFTANAGPAPIKREKTELEIIKEMESDFQKNYKFAFDRMLNRTDCLKVYELLLKRWDKEDFPIPVQLRFEQLCEEYKPKFESPNPMLEVDCMEGHAFEEWCANLLRKLGYADVTVTPGSGDQGVDIIAVKDEIRYAIQCKCYSSDLGNTPIQEVNAGKAFYRCQIGVVMTNRHFTSGAIALADATGTLLWDRDKLEDMIKAAREQ